jgi:CrcB protein
MKLVYIGAFGMAGVLARYLLGEASSALPLPSFPWGTFLVNLLGAFLIGLAFVAGTEKALLSPELRLGLTVGFLGGFTTFSALALESVALYSEGRAWHAALYLTLTNLLGVGAVLAGISLGRVLIVGRPG